MCNECKKIMERKDELLTNYFNYLSELINDEEKLKSILKNSIGFTDEEIVKYGFCFKRNN